MAARPTLTQCIKKDLENKSNWSHRLLILVGLVPQTTGPAARTKILEMGIENWELEPYPLLPVTPQKL